MRRRTERDDRMNDVGRGEKAPRAPVITPTEPGPAWWLRACGGSDRNPCQFPEGPQVVRSPIWKVRVGPGSKYRLPVAFTTTDVM
jgi:hypothetical protein